jgi:hypothetical protein
VIGSIQRLRGSAEVFYAKLQIGLALKVVAFERERELDPILLLRE